jgi:putative transposase
MSHSHLCCLLHVVFSTAERRPLIREEMRDRLHAYLGAIARENSMVALAVGGVADHVHLLLSLPRTISVSKAVQLLKAGSSKWINESFSELGRFSWQEGYGAFSIGVAQREKTVAYIRAQAEHHKTGQFQRRVQEISCHARPTGGEMIQPSLTGLVAFLEGHPALGSAKHGLVGPTFLRADPGASTPSRAKAARAGDPGAGLLSCVPCGTPRNPIHLVKCRHS